MADLVKVRQDFWPRMNFSGHFKVTKVKIAPSR